MCVLPKATLFYLARVVAAAALLHVCATGRGIADDGCLTTQTVLSSEEVAAFLVRPAALLDQYPAGGPPLSAHVQRLAASDLATVRALIALAANAKSAHLVAIAVGLGRAAGNCSRKHPALAGMIKQLVAQEGAPGLRAVFASEATLTELAFGALPEGAQPAPPGAPPGRDTVAAPDDETANTPLVAALKARKPGFLLPTAPGTLPAAPDRPDLAASRRDTADAGSLAGSGTPASAIDELTAALASLNVPARFFTAFGPEESESPPPEDDRAPLPFAPGKGGHDGFALRHEALPDDDVPSFGNGGLTETSNGTVSPVR